jgi:hypothetical protein
MKRKLIVGAVAGAAAILFAVTTSRADPKLANVGRHRHYIKTATGELVEVGPRFCDNPDLQRAFNQFHNNVHMVSETGIGPSAPGLHNLQGAEIMSGRC